MEFIKILKINGQEYHIFYDENINAFNYFCHVEGGETDCLTLAYNNVKDVLAIPSIEYFKSNYEDIMQQALSKGELLGRKMIMIQSFANGFWEDMILTKFKDCKVSFIDTEI